MIDWGGWRAQWPNEPIAHEPILAQEGGWFRGAQRTDEPNAHDKQERRPTAPAAPCARPPAGPTPACRERRPHLREPALRPDRPTEAGRSSSAGPHRHCSWFFKAPWWRVGARRCVCAGECKKSATGDLGTARSSAPNTRLQSAPCLPLSNFSVLNHMFMPPPPLTPATHNGPPTDCSRVPSRSWFTSI